MTRFFGIILFFASISNVFAFQNEPDGFRSIKWGTDISRSSELVFSRNYSTDFDGIKVYKKRFEDLEIGGARVDEIEYYAWQDKFYKVRASTGDLMSSGTIYQACMDRFGDIAHFEGKSVVWEGTITKIIMTERSQSGNQLSMESIELANKLRPLVRQKEVERGLKGF